MPFLHLHLDAGARDPEPIEEALFTVGATSVTLTDAADDPVLEPAPGMTPLWPRVKIEALFAGDVEPSFVTAELEKLLPETLPSLRFTVLEDRVWEREWLKDFRPLQFGQRLWICPGGQRPPEKTDTPVIVELDPGLAFGTGTHPTTALCLEWLESADLEGTKVVDFGCGSGILAIAALKLGAVSAMGIDIDPQALLASRDNAERNGVGARLTLLQHPAVAVEPADILLANILADPLLSLASYLQSLVVPGGRIVLSGILQHQTAAVAAKYAPWFDVAPVVLRGEWARLHGVRRAPVCGSP